MLEQVAVNTTKDAIVNVSTEVALETTKNLAFGGGSNLTVQGAVLNTGKSFLGTAGGFLTSLGVSLAVQGILSIGSALCSSSWEKNPEIVSLGIPKDGK